MWFCTPNYTHLIVLTELMVTNVCKNLPSSRHISSAKHIIIFSIIQAKTFILFSFDLAMLTNWFPIKHTNTARSGRNNVILKISYSQLPSSVSFTLSLTPLSAHSSPFSPPQTPRIPFPQYLFYTSCYWRKSDLTSYINSSPNLYVLCRNLQGMRSDDVSISYRCPGKRLRWLTTLPLNTQFYTDVSPSF